MKPKSAKRDETGCTNQQHDVQKEKNMSETVNRKSKDKASRGTTPPATAIRALIADLRSKDGMLRQRSRQSLVAIGKPAVISLVKLLRDRNDQVRWEASKALGEIGDRRAAPALIAALEDEEFDVRWLAAEGLIALGGEGLVPLLEALVECPQSVWLRAGAHHFLHDLAKAGLRKKVAALLEALEGVEPEIEVPSAARKLLNTLEGKNRRKSDGQKENGLLI
jgi:HEAT repeat protein